MLKGFRVQGLGFRVSGLGITLRTISFISSTVLMAVSTINRSTSNRYRHRTVSSPQKTTSQKSTPHHHIAPPALQPSLSNPPPLQNQNVAIVQVGASQTVSAAASPDLPLRNTHLKSYQGSCYNLRPIPIWVETCSNKKRCARELFPMYGAAFNARRSFEKTSLVTRLRNPGSLLELKWGYRAMVSWSGSYIINRQLSLPWRR